MDLDHTGGTRATKNYDVYKVSQRSGKELENLETLVLISNEEED